MIDFYKDNIKRYYSHKGITNLETYVVPTADKDVIKRRRRRRGDNRGVQLDAEATDVAVENDLRDENNAVTDSEYIEANLQIENQGEVEDNIDSESNLFILRPRRQLPSQQNATLENLNSPIIRSSSQQNTTSEPLNSPLIISSQQNAISDPLNSPIIRSNRNRQRENRMRNNVLTRYEDESIEEGDNYVPPRMEI